MKKFLAVLFILFLLGPTAQAQEPYKVWLPMLSGGAFNSDNNWRIIQPVESTNQVLNPSAETTGNFAALGAATVTRVTTYQKYGLYSYRVQTAGDNQGISLTLSTLAAANQYVTMRVRGTLPVAWDWSLDNSNYYAPNLIQKIDASWNLYGLHVQSGSVSGTTLYIRQNGAGSGDFNIDGVQVEALDYWTTYIDGTQDGCVWTGATNASTSQRSGLSRAGGQEVDLWTGYKFQVLKVTGAAAATHQLGVDSYALLPGGALNSDKIQSRQFVITGKFIANTESDLLEAKADLEAAFYTPDNQLTRLRFNGSTVQKEIAVRYQGGLEGDLAAFYGNIEVMDEGKYNEHLVYTENAALQVVAPYPFWQAVGESAAALDTDDSATFRIVAARLSSTGQWDDLGPPNAAGTYNSIDAFAEDATYIYVGGDFLNFNNIAAADYIARYNKSTGAWSALGSGTDGAILALTIGPDGSLYAGGGFANAGGGAAANIAKWNGSAWSALGAGVDNNVYALAFGMNGKLYATGAFSNAGGGAAAYIASWDGAAWAALGSGLGATGRALAVAPNYVYVGGTFTTAGGSGANRAARWDYVNSAWSALGSGLSGNVYGMAFAPSGILYVAGSTFFQEWNGAAWTDHGGLSSDANTVTIGPDGIVYVGGAFGSLPSLSFNGPIRWNGSSFAYTDINFGAGNVVHTLYASKFYNSTTPYKYSVFLGAEDSTTQHYAGIATATNNGTVAAYPKIVYYNDSANSGLVSNLRNETTGKELSLNYDMVVGETLTIDLQPLAQTVNSSLFGRRFDGVLASSDFGSFALEPGANSITTFVQNSGGGAITAYMVWHETFSSY